MAENLMYNSHGKKYAVPRERVFSIFELRSGDHIALHQVAGTYWHHAIVEYIDMESDDINVIHYSNTARGFIEDNFSSPKTPAKARVVRNTYKFSKEKVYRMKHERCFDADTVVRRAQSKVGTSNYNVFTNNCEHFAMWCKTGISSSDQVDKAGEMIVSNELKQCAPKAVQKLVERGVREGANKSFTRTTSAAAQRAGQEFVHGGARMATNQALTRSASRAGQEFVRGGVRMATNQALTRSASRAGQEFVHGGVRMATNQALTRSASRAGQEFVHGGIRMATNQALTLSASRAGQEFVHGGVRMATNQALTRSASRAGQAFVRGGVRVATNQAFTQTASQTGTAAGIGGLESVAGMAGGVALGAAIEGISMAYDIDCAHGDMAAGRISPRQYDHVVGKRIVTGTANVGGSAVGMLVGQAVIPVPVVGGVIGAIAGGIFGSMFGNLLVNL